MTQQNGNFWTYGSPTQFKALPTIERLIEQISDKKNQLKITRFLSALNTEYKKLNTLDNIPKVYKTSLITIYKKDYLERINRLSNFIEYNPVLITHIKNFINAKFKTLQK